MRRFAALLVALGLGFALLVLPGTPAWACSCAVGDADSQAEWADQIFTATMTDTTERGRGIEMTLAVGEVFKGEVDAKTVVVTSNSPASCGLAEFPGEGEVWLFFTTSTGVMPDRGDDEDAPEALRTGLCNGSAEVNPEHTDALADSLGEPTEPRGAGVGLDDDLAAGDSEANGATGEPRGADSGDDGGTGVPLWPWVTGLLLIGLAAGVRVARRTT